MHTSSTMKKVKLEVVKMKITKITLAILLCFAMIVAIGTMAFGAPNGGARSLPETPQLYLSLTSDNGQTQNVRATQASVNWFNETKGVSSQGINLWDMNNRGIIPVETVYLSGNYGEIELSFLYSANNYPPDSIEVLKWTSAHVLGNFGTDDDIYYGAATMRIHGNSFRVMNYDNHDYVYQVSAQWGNNSSIYYFRTLNKAVPITAETITASSWAQEQVSAAIIANLVPQNLQSNYTQTITRAEFCALAVSLYERLRGEITGRTTFADTNDTNIEKMAYLGVISGVGNNRFEPNETLTREQAAVMLTRLAKAIGHPFPAQAATFADNDRIASWAIESVGKVQEAGIMDGIGGNRFAPDQPYTREQSIVTIMRALDVISAKFISDLPITLPNQPIPYEVGSVIIISNDVEYEPHEHFLHGGLLTEHGFMSASGIPLSLEEVSRSLTAIEHSDNFQVVIDGKYANSVSFSLYNDNFESIYRSKDSFVIPDEAGIYMLCIDVTWSNEENPSQYREFTTIRYIFKVMIP